MKKKKPVPSPAQLVSSAPAVLAPTLTCLRCGHTWMPRTVRPIRCPAVSCHSPYWWIEKGKLPQGAAAWRGTEHPLTKWRNDLRKSKKRG